MFDLIQNIIQPIIWFATAPLTAVLHLIIGHAILHAANPHSSTWSPSLQSTASAGAVGGTILGVPLVPLYIYLALLEEERLENYRLEHPADDSVEVCTMFHSFTSLMEWAARGAILVGGGCAAGALGVVCLRDTGTRMLSPGAAALAGLVGGAVLVGCAWALRLLPFTASFTVSFKIRMK